jgi:hypothetical protein
MNVPDINPPRLEVPINCPLRNKKNNNNKKKNKKNHIAEY